MKRIVKLTAALLCVLMLLPMYVFGYPDRIVENDPVSMPKASPKIDGNIEDTGAWSDVVYVNDPTLGHFWATRPLTFEAEAYFAYDDSGLYFAADIHDNDTDSGFVPATGYDNVDDDYGFNGDVMTLMLDALGLFERSSYQDTPWYHVGIYADGKVGVYRTNGNQGDITSSCSAVGKITDDGWLFEVRIPWSVIVSDVSKASSGKLTATQVKLATVGSVSRAACMYMDRYYTPNGSVATWGRFITVCNSAYDGTVGVKTGGTKAKTYGITLNHTNGHEHNYVITSSVEPTCTKAGNSISTCSLCGEVQNKILPAKGHTAGDKENIFVSCTQDGTAVVRCVDCGITLSQSVIAAPGHSMGDWYIVTDASAQAHGLKRSECANCDYYEDEVIPSSAIPYLSVKNYDMSVTLADQIRDVRFVQGSYSTPAEIKAAAGNVALSSAIVTANTKDGIFTYEMPTTGSYSVWVRMQDGRNFILPAEVNDINPSLSAYGVKVSIHDIRPDVKDFFIAKGKYNSYSEIKAAGYIVNITSAKIAGKHDYSYTVYEDGVHTVLIRYTDGTSDVLNIELTVDKPEFTENGLQVTVSNLPDVKVIRTAKGTWSTVKELKATDSIRNFSAKTAIKGKDPYTIQYREEGPVTVIVEYNNGYVSVHHYNVTFKKPSVSDNGPSISFGDLDGLVIIRYAEGTYTTSAQIKNASGSKYIKPAEAEDGVITVYDLTPGRVYTFCVQYDDESYNYYTYVPTEAPALYVGDQRQVMVEDYIVEERKTTASFFYGQPVKKQKVFTFNKAWETKDTVYHNITQLPDGSYRMYYKATSDLRRICYIESKDGITWTRPSNSNNKYNGSNSNIVTGSGLSPDNLFVFYDTNPACPDSQRWKGIYGQWGDGLFLEYATDNGKNFPFYPYEATLLSTPAATKGCYFDTLNTMYWDEARGKYVAFVRGFHYGDNYNLTKAEVESIGGAKIVRDIRYSESVDCINWTVPVPLNYSNEADWQMYANAIIPYYRAEQLYVGMPTRYQWLTDLPEVDIFMMASRDLLNWERSEEPFMTDNGSTWDYGDSGYPCVGFIETPSDLSAYGVDNELSFYMKEWDDNAGCTVLYRYTLRLDGFRGVYGSEGQKFVTKTFTFEGDSMEFNYAVAPGGSIKITIADTAGNTISTDWFSGDDCDATVSFNGDLSQFSGKKVVMTVDMNNASFYSFKFN